MDKKAQAQIITVVLIILLVLAAIVIVWQVIRSTVQESAAEVAGGTECITLALSIKEPVTVGDPSIIVERGVGSADLAKIRVIVGGVTETTDFDASGLAELESDSITLDAVAALGNKIEIAGILTTKEGEKLCDVADDATVVA